MALGREEFNNLLKEIAMSGGDTDNMLKLMQKLRDDFDEREGILRNEGETEDKESPANKSEEEKIEEESNRDDREDNGLRRDPIETVPKSEYEALRSKYIERFFGTFDEAKAEQKEGVEDDSKDKTFDELFKKREGVK